MYIFRKALPPTALDIHLRGCSDGTFALNVKTIESGQSLVIGQQVQADDLLTEVVRVLRSAGLEFEGPELPSRAELEQGLSGDAGLVAAEGGLVTEEEVSNFPRMRVVRETILATGGRPTRAKMGEGAAIIGAFVEYELRGLLASNASVDDVPTDGNVPSTLPPPCLGDGEEYEERIEYLLPPGEEKEFEFTAPHVLAHARVEVAPREVVKIVELNVSGEPMPPDMVNAPNPVLRLARNEKVFIKVRSESGIPAGLVVALRGIVQSSETDRAPGETFGARESATGR